jgi:hypothetical protein
MTRIAGELDQIAAKNAEETVTIKMDGGTF